MRSYVCPQCGNKGPVMLVPGQVCQVCRSSRVWSRHTGGKPLVIRFGKEPSAAPELRPFVAPAPASKSGWVTILRAVPLLLLAGAVTLLVYFFKARPGGPLESRLWWSQVVAVWAIGMAGLSVLASLWWVARPARGGEATSGVAHMFLLGTAIVAAAVSVAALLCWGRTGKIHAAPTLPRTINPLLARTSRATAVIYAHDEQVNRYRPSVGSGVVVGAHNGHTWILTVSEAKGGPWSNLSEAEEIRVGFSGGEMLSGRLRWAARPPVNLALVEVDAEVTHGRAQFRPVAEGLIPTETVFAIPNPLSHGWGVEQGEVLGRSSLRLPSGWLCRVSTNLRLQSYDAGGGLFDGEGRLLGLYEGQGAAGGQQSFFLITSTLAASIEAAVNSGDFSTL